MDAILGDGMPWHLIMVCFGIGILIGIQGEKKSRKTKVEGGVNRQNED